MIAYNYNNLMEAKTVFSDAITVLGGQKSDYSILSLGEILDNIAETVVTGSNSIFYDEGSDGTLNFYGNKLHEVAANLQDVKTYTQNVIDFIDNFVSDFDVLEKDTNSRVSLDSGKFSRLRQLYQYYGIGTDDDLSVSGGGGRSFGNRAATAGIASVFANALRGVSTARNNILNNLNGRSLLTMTGGSITDSGTNSLFNQQRNPSILERAYYPDGNYPTITSIRITHPESTAAAVTTGGATAISAVQQTINDNNSVVIDTAVSPTNEEPQPEAISKNPTPIDPTPDSKPISDTPIDKPIEDQPIDNTPTDDSNPGDTSTNDPNVNDNSNDHNPADDANVSNHPGEDVTPSTPTPTDSNHQNTTNASGSSTVNNREPGVTYTKNNTSSMGSSMDMNSSAPVGETPSNSLTENIQTENTMDLFGDVDDYISLDDTTSNVGKDTSTGGSGVIPIAVGLGAAAAVGVGAKVYKDRKENNDLDLNEDRPSNENKFWTTEDSSVIHSEKDDYAQPFGMNESNEYEPTAYKATDHSEEDINKDTWEMPDTNQATEQMIDLLGNE